MNITSQKKPGFIHTFSETGYIGLSLLFIWLWLPTNIRAVELKPENNELMPDLINEKIKVDGELTENAWQLTPIHADLITFSPAYGERLGPKTVIWLAYDHKNLYFAFRCEDPEPDKIKTSISKRDNQNNDDWIGVLIDGMGNRQSTYEFYTNPSGIQLDGITSATNADVLNIAHDFVWESASRITSTGFQTEISIPLSSLRFKGGTETTMGVMFMRNISRYGKMGAWPEIKAGLNQFNFMATVRYLNLKKMLNFEVLPNFTMNSNADRTTSKHWGARELSKNLGASIKFGMTSAITTEATMNPDFSQVESDALQVEVNQRYPIFYTEKRPFFMEGINAFDFALVTDGMMFSPVYTRFIIDPGWAGKISGTSGRTQFAVLAANDQAPGQENAGENNPNTGREAYWGLARAKYSLGDDNSIGMIYSGHNFTDLNQHTAGADLQYRFYRNLRLTLSYLYSTAELSDSSTTQTGSGLNAMLQYADRRFRCWTAYERWDENFAMASAFMNRSGISRGQIFSGVNFYPQKWSAWLRRVQPYVRYERLLDLQTDQTDWATNLGVTVFTSRSGIFQAFFREEQEAWAAQLFQPTSAQLAGQVQITNWLSTYLAFKYGEKIYYDPMSPFMGIGHRVRASANFQPHLKTNFDLEYIQDTFYRELSGQSEKIYVVDIVNLLATYQFNKYFFIRGALRYNDFDKILLTDFLASFTLIPGTVMHLGYGALYKQREWQTDHWAPGPHLKEMKNSLFFKVSYLWRM